MASIDEIRNERIKKLHFLKERGINAFPTSSRRDITAKEALRDFSKLSKRKKTFYLVGRIMRLRRQGGMIFFHFDDGTDIMQGLVKKSDDTKEIFSLFCDTVDIGDFAELKGSLFTTKRGEKTLLVLGWKMLSKSIRPLPDKWHGLSNIEERFRRRYLDLLMSSEAKERFFLRSRLLVEIRSYLEDEGYMEVQTPTLQPLYGGGNAEPFVTHHNALDRDLYLRVSNELYLKRLLIAGFPKVYELYKGFRNEGIDAVHYPEFTMLEFYESYSDASVQMHFVENFVKALVKKLVGKTTIVYGEYKLDFNNAFKVVSYYDVLKRHALIIDPENTTHDEWALKAQQFGITMREEDGDVKIMDAIFKKVCRPKLVQPTFLVDYPVQYLPLAKKKENNPSLVDAFQLVIGGIELVKAFSELNDPFDQRERFEEQEESRKRGDKEAQPMDEDFIEAMEYGMPPAGGVGIGVDRLVMLLTNTKNIKEVILFPSMRAKADN